jgi:hypothetical protein
MLGVFGGFDPLIEVERDRAFDDVEQEARDGTLQQTAHQRSREIVRIAETARRAPD